MIIFFIIEIIGYSSYQYCSREFPTIKSKSKIANIVVIHLQKVPVVTNTNSINEQNIVPYIVCVR